MVTHVVEEKVMAIHADEVCISSGSDALDLFMNLSYQTGLTHFAINKGALHPDFFKLATGLAGDVLQKCSNYHWKLAIYGDFENIQSKPLRDFIGESNRGKDIFFLPDEEQAVEKLLSL